MICPRYDCKNDVDYSSAGFCTNCGTKLVNNPKCDNCGTTIENVSWVYCRRCGFLLKEWKFKCQ